MFTRKNNGGLLRLLAIGVCLAGCEFASGKTIYVSPAGNDDAPGVKESPLATIARARDVVREQRKTGPLTEPVTISLAAGRYELTEPLTLTARDSGTPDCPVTYRGAEGEKVVISGGRRITGWQKGHDNIWTVNLPKVKQGENYFRQLFVDGRRATRARTPDRSNKNYAWGVLDHKLGGGLDWQYIDVEPDKVRQWNNLSDVEIVVFKNWASFHKRIYKVEPQKGRIWPAPPHVGYSGGNRPRRGTYFFLENALEFLDQPGEWYLDRRKGLLYYKPLPGQDMNAVEVIAPSIPHILKLQGSETKPVQYVKFENISFMHNSYLLAAQGHHGRQACFRYGGDPWNGLPATVQWEYAENCTVSGCEIAHCGGNGIELRAACRNNIIQGNAVYDVAGNGVGVGYRTEEKTVPTTNRIANNHIRDCGAVFLGACGVWSGLARETVIEHNLIEDLPYSAISIGWVWNDAPSVVRDNLAAWNKIQNVLCEVSDGGGIYTLGYQPGTVIRDNHIFNIRRGPYAHAAPNNGIFLDEGSKGYLIERNLIHDTVGKTVRHNQNSPGGHLWKGNVFIEGAVKESDKDLPDVRQKAGLEPIWKKRLLAEKK